MTCLASYALSISFCRTPPDESSVLRHVSSGSTAIPLDLHNSNHPVRLTDAVLDDERRMEQDARPLAARLAARDRVALESNFDLMRGGGDRGAVRRVRPNVGQFLLGGRLEGDRILHRAPNRCQISARVRPPGSCNRRSTSASSAR